MFPCVNTVQPVLKERGRKQLNCYQNERISKTKIFGAHFMQIPSITFIPKKLLKNENLVISSWEPENQ